MLYKLKCCGKCEGDMTIDGDEWHCLQCGTYYYPQFPVVNLSEDSTLVLRTIDYEPDRGIVGIKSSLEDLVLIP